jgi:hypothetical protein
MHSILLGVEGGLFARREALRDVVFAYALRVVCRGQGESDLVHAGAEEIINLAMSCGRTLGEIAEKSLRHFASLIKPKRNSVSFLSSYTLYLS